MSKSNQNKCTICGEPSIVGLVKGSGKCQFHWNEGVWWQEWAEKLDKEKRAKMKINKKMQVVADAPFHANQIGYFQFEGEGPSEGAVVLSTESTEGKDTRKCVQLFAVSSKHLIEI